MSLRAAGLLAAAVVCLAGTGRPSLAAEPSDFAWNGIYFGIHGGYGGAQFTGLFGAAELPGNPDSVAFAEDMKALGYIAGLQLGVNGQTGSFVYGVEADFSMTGIADTVFDGIEEDSLEAEVHFLTSLRARAGVAAGPILAYVTGGVAYGGFNFTATDDAGQASENAGDAYLTAVGAVAGGGFEAALGHGVSFRVEGLYYHFFDASLDSSLLTISSAEGDVLGINGIWAARAGLNLRM